LGISTIVSHSRAVVASILAVAALCGCYEFVPTDTSAPPALGERYSFEISDQGRVMLSERMGSGLASVEGTLTEESPEQYVVSVRRVNRINGEYSLWTGDIVRIQREAVSDVLERKLSRPKTFFAAGSAALGFGVMAASSGIFGSSDVSTVPPVDTGPATNRVWR
jgi:hypothetical protein